MIIRPEEWITVPHGSEAGLLLATMASGEIEFPIPIETHNVHPDEVTMGENQDFELILECADAPAIYPNKDFYDKHAAEQFFMAAESVIPAGAFSISDDPDFTPTPQVILNGQVTETYDEDDPASYGLDEDDILYSLSCLGNEYDAILHAELANGAEIKKGNIVCGVYWVQGWPRGE